MNKTMMRALRKVFLAFVLFVVSTTAWAQVDIRGENIFSNIKEETHNPDLLKGIVAYEKKDFVAASNIFESLAGKGYSRAQYCLARMYMQGLGGLRPDYKKALELTNKAAEHGVVDAEELLGFLYYYGLGVPQDHKQAADWLLKAAEQGNSESQDNLGFLYEKGQGVPQDWVQAYKWYSLAFKGGEEDSRAKIERAAGQMTPEQITEAEALQTKTEKEIRLIAAAKAKTNEEERTTSNRKEVLKMVNEWAAAWSSKDVKRYLVFYAEDFKTPGGESRIIWETQRHGRISSPKSIHVSISNPKVKFIDDSHASVSFQQSYSANHLNNSSRKTLLLVKSEGNWLIQEEHSEK